MLDASTAHDHLLVIVALDPNGIALMQRDMELIRRILLELKSRKDSKPKSMTLDGVDQSVLLRHLELLFKAGLIELGPNIHYSRQTHEPYFILVRDMTWTGSDLLAAMENDSVWSKNKTSFGTELATIPFEVIRAVGIDLLVDWGKEAAKAAIGS